MIRGSCARRTQGGYGLPSQWSDDFHHSLHSLLTGERAGYYSDFGDVHHLAVTMRNGWFYAGQHSNFRRRKHGNSPAGLARSSFVVCIQNHDQIGNRARGDRLSNLLDFEALEAGGGCNGARALRASAIHGRRVWRKSAVSVFHQSRRSRI